MDPTSGKLPFLEWAIAGRPKPGEIESGDQHVVEPLPDGALLAVVDGLGTGRRRRPRPARPSPPCGARPGAARRAGQTLSRGPETDSRCGDDAGGVSLWRQPAHLAECRQRRGPPGTSADVLARPPRDTVLQRGGVVGYQLPLLQTSVLVVGPGDMLILATDGIRGRFADGLDLDRRPQEIAEFVLAGHAKHNDDALVLVGASVHLLLDSRLPWMRTVPLLRLPI